MKFIIEKKIMEQKQKDPTPVGILVFYVDIQQMPPFKAEAFIDRLKTNFEGWEGIGTIWLPVRNQPTRVEWIPVKTEKKSDECIKYSASILDDVGC